MNVSVNDKGRLTGQNLGLFGWQGSETTTFCTCGDGDTKLRDGIQGWQGFECHGRCYSPHRCLRCLSLLLSLVSLLVVGCWLLIVDCWLLIVDCWLLVVGCWLLVVDC